MNVIIIMTFWLGGEVFGERGMLARKELPPSATWTSSEWASDLNFLVKFFLNVFVYLFVCFLLKLNTTRQVLVSSSSSEVQLLRVWILETERQNLGSVSAASVIVIPRGQKNMSRVENCVFSRSQSGAIEAAFYMAV